MCWRKFWSFLWNGGEILVEKKDICYFVNCRNYRKFYISGEIWSPCEIWFLTLSKEPDHEKKWNIFVDIISIFALTAHLRSQGILLICVLPSSHISVKHSFNFTVIEMIISLLTIILHSLTLDFKNKSRCLSGMHCPVSTSLVTKIGLFSYVIITAHMNCTYDLT